MIRSLTPQHTANRQRHAQTKTPHPSPHPSNPTVHAQVDCEVGRPKVNYRETVRRKAEFNYLHKKQSGGSGERLGGAGGVGV